MKNKKKKVLRSAREARYGSFISVGELLGIGDPELQNAIKVEFLPQWEEHGQTEAVLSKRSLLIDIGVSDVNLDDIKRLARSAELVRLAALDHPDTLLKIIQAFGHSGSKKEREQTLDRAETLRLWRRGDPEPAALWGVLLLAGAAILLAGCCQETDTECNSDTDTEDGRSSGP